MRWKGGRRSDNVEDYRGRSTGRRGGGLPGGMRLPIGGGRGGCSTIIFILIALYLFSNGGSFLSGGGDSKVSLPDLGSLGQGFPDSSSQQQQTSPSEYQTQNGNVGANYDQMKDFVSVVLGDTEDTWRTIFRQYGKTYREPKLVLFSGYVRSACGMAQSASGPFYCPADQKLYIDLKFYEELKRRHNAPGDFAQAYVIAHEVGHHVQNLQGTSDQVQNYQRRASKVDANRALVRLELQADCYAGIWANHAHRARNILEQGDIEEAMNAAAQIGDDTLQRQSQGYVVPESFTHGTAKQRMTWFKRGLQSGDVGSCDTFNSQI